MQTQTSDLPETAAKPDTQGRFGRDDLLAAFWVLLHPNYWLQNHPYSPEWDEELNRLIATETFTEYDGYTAKLGKHLVWVANHPYASMTIRYLEVRPRRRTIYLAHRKLVRDMMAANI